MLKATLCLTSILLTLTTAPRPPSAGRKSQRTRGCITPASCAVSLALVPSAFIYLSAPISCSRLDAVNKVIFTSDEGIFEKRNWRCELLTPSQVTNLKIVQMR